MKNQGKKERIYMKQKNGLQMSSSLPVMILLNLSGGTQDACSYFFKQFSPGSKQPHFHSRSTDIHAKCIFSHRYPPVIIFPVNYFSLPSHDSLNYSFTIQHFLVFIQAFTYICLLKQFHFTSKPLMPSQPVPAPVASSV